MYQAVEDLYRIYIEFMAEYYGDRFVDVATPAEVQDVFQFLGQATPPEVPLKFDFSQLKDIPMQMKMDVGASSYYSEIASIQTLDNLLKMDKINTLQYLERIPDGYIPARRELINELKEMERLAMMQQQAAMQMPQGNQQLPQEQPVAGEMTKPEIPTGGGYSALQRKINETGTTAGIV